MTKQPRDEKQIFFAALEKSTSQERDAFIESECAGDSELLERVKVLLESHNESVGPLDSPPPGINPTADMPAITEKPGDTIGPYKLLQEIGEGGFGVVYMAEQEQPVRRKVALKLIKPGMDTREVIARFEAEKQALAMMDHPHIARVLDAGTTDSGRPYFVMELVKGVPITAYCDRNNLSAPQRLELFMTVCRAVQHAHQKGIIHRDIKPSNVMVTLHDGEPVVKVIDFGVAKAINHKLTEKTMFTNFGQMIGTPMYMSPEQAEMSGLDIDTRTDIYSLGVLLYELLTGTTPFDQQRLREAGYDEIRRIIREEEPPKPSRRLSTLGETLPSVAANRHTEPRKLSTLVRGDLDWIVMKSLEKDRTRRYETANDLAREIERFLNDEPVEACPPSATYRFKKFARRNKAPLSIASAVILVLVAVAIGSSIAAGKFRKLAQKNADLVVEKEDALSKAIDAEQAATKARDEATAAANREKGLRLEADRQRRRAEANVQVALEVLDRVYLRLAEERVPGKLHIKPVDEKFLKDALPFYERLTEQGADDPKTRFARALAYQRVGTIYYHFRQRGTTEDAIPALRRSAQLFEGLVENFPANLTYQQRLADTYRWLGIALQDRSGRSGRSGEAVDALYQSVAVYKSILNEVPSCRHELLSSYISLPLPLTWDLGRHKEAEVAARAALTLGEKLTAENPDERVNYSVSMSVALERLATALNNQSRAREAEEASKRSVDLLSAMFDEFPDGVGLRISLGRSLGEYGRLLSARGSDEAADVYRRAIDLLTTTENHSNPYDLGKAYRGLGTILHQKGQLPEAENNLRMSVATHEQLAADYPGNALYHMFLSLSRRMLAHTLRARGLAEQAEDQFQQTIRDCTRAIELNPQSWQCYSIRRSCYLELGQTDKARDDDRARGDVLLKKVTLNPSDATSLNKLAWLLATSPDPEMLDVERALLFAEKAAEIAPKNPSIWNTLGVARYRAGAWNAAVEALTESMKLGKGANHSIDAFFLAMAHWQLGEKDRAREWYDKAVTWMENNMPYNEELARFREEAAQLLGVNVPTVAPKPAVQKSELRKEEKQESGVRH